MAQRSLGRASRRHHVVDCFQFSPGSASHRPRRHHYYLADLPAGAQPALHHHDGTAGAACTAQLCKQGGSLRADHRVAVVALHCGDFLVHGAGNLCDTMGLGEAVMLSPAHPVQLFLGLGCWIIWFAGIYGGLSLACAAAAPHPAYGPWTAINLALWISSLLLAALLCFWAWRCWRWLRHNANASAAQRMVARVGGGLHAVAAFSTLAVGATVLALPPCL